MIHSSQIHCLPSQKEAEYLSGWQRARADLDNFKKRISQQASSDNSRYRQEIISSLLPLADNFQAMTQHFPPELKDNAWAEGVLYVVRQLEQLLAEYGLRPIEAINQPFDPALHEAVGTRKKKGVTAGSIIEVIQTGYILSDEVIRPAKVKVAA